MGMALKERLVGWSMLIALLASARFVMAADGSVPKQMVGEWLAGSSSLSTYWDTSGNYVGPSSGAGQVYQFNQDGTFDYYIVMELRTYSYVSHVRTHYKGTVNFDGENFTLHLTQGHYNCDSPGRVINRDMTEDELVKQSKSYSYRLEKDQNGKPKFVVPFADGSKFEFRQNEPTPTKKN